MTQIRSYMLLHVNSMNAHMLTELWSYLRAAERIKKTHVTSTHITFMVSDTLCFYVSCWKKKGWSLSGQQDNLLSFTLRLAGELKLKMFHFVQGIMSVSFDGVVLNFPTRWLPTCKISFRV